MTVAPQPVLPPLSLDDARLLAFALMATDTRPLVVLDIQVKHSLGIVSAKPMRVDVLHNRLFQLVDSCPLWRARGVAARRRLLSQTQQSLPANAGLKVRA
ncbi:hypothetical protein [Nitrospirillum bahiense]|uniref:Uncharacterized protein n=1 Tax=Nitrospirillum amazonense TaxID=28077 RepID=A0A560F1X6_9PROT|nr:hypothetical protein [Nitrospirillum amazonense]TWB15611.1 hypothetical protein FBZ88_12964 [Nitrospirillum amazonense]